MKTMFRWTGVVIVALLMLGSTGDASRIRRPMGDYVREADLIVVGDARRGADGNLETVLSVREVIKGDAKAVGTDIVLGGPRSTADVYVPVPAEKIVVLLQSDRFAKNLWPVVEMYAKAEEIAVVHTLVEIYRVPNERQRLVALRQKALAGDAILLSQLLCDLSDMREPANLDLMVDLFDSLAPADQVKLTERLGATNDLRAVPTLIKAMQSPDDRVSGAGAHKLTWIFPGASGVTEAFEKALAREHLRRYAADYLSKRREAPALDAIRPATPWMVAQRLWSGGQKAEAMAAFLAMIEDAKAGNYVRFEGAKLILPVANPLEKDRIRMALLPSLTAAAHGDNWLDRASAAKILRGLHHPDCLEPLLSIITRTDYIDQEAARMATMAVRELGPEMRMRAAAHLVGGMEAASKVQDAEPYRLALLWVADRNILDKAAQAMPATWINSWAKLSPLYAVVDEPDEGALLIRVLGQSGELSMTARNWVVFRLGDLKDKRAIHLLTEALVRVYGNREARDALSSIGGVEVENQMLALLRDKNQGVRSMATEVLFRLQGPRGCDLARRMVREDNFGERMLAMSHLGQFGTADDLPLLLPCCDYWKADRRNIYWATSAVVQIRERCIYDINGPIVRQAGAK